MNATYAGRPVEIVQDFDNGITRVKFLDVKRAYRAKLSGESNAEHAARLASGEAVWDVATSKVTQD